VPAVTDKCNVGVAGGAREVDRFFLHADLVEIQTDDRLKTKPLQRLGHVRRIILRILKCGGIFVCRIAYDERDALLGMRSHAAEMTNAKITASNRMAPAPWIAQVCHWQIAVATAYAWPQKAFYVACAAVSNTDALWPTDWLTSNSKTAKIAAARMVRTILLMIA
jgi:hypothetical protein